MFKTRLHINCIDKYWYERVHEMSKHMKTHERTWPRKMVWVYDLVSIKKTRNSWQWMGYITPVTRQQLGWPHPHNEVTDVSLCQGSHQNLHIQFPDISKCFPYICIGNFEWNRNNIHCYIIQKHSHNQVSTSSHKIKVNRLSWSPSTLYGPDIQQSWLG